MAVDTKSKGDDSDSLREIEQEIKDMLGDDYQPEPSRSKTVLEEKKAPSKIPIKKLQTSKPKIDPLAFDKKLKKDDILWAQNKALVTGSTIKYEFDRYSGSLSRKPKKPIVDPKELLDRPKYNSKGRTKPQSKQSEPRKITKISHSGQMLF